MKLPRLMFLVCSNQTYSPFNNITQINIPLSKFTSIYMKIFHQNDVIVTQSGLLTECVNGPPFSGVTSRDFSCNSCHFYMTLFSENVLIHCGHGNKERNVTVGS